MSISLENNFGQLTQTSSTYISYFTNRHGIELFCNFSIKKPGEKRIWIINQMWPSEIFTLLTFLHDNLSVNTFKFDYTGDGNSQGEFSFSAFIRSADDIDDAVNFLTERGYEVEGIIAMSMCANSAIIYSALYGQVKKIIILSARFRMNILPDFLQEVYEITRKKREIFHFACGKQLRLTWDMIEETVSLDMKYYCERVQGDIYIIHGDSDEVCPYSNSLDYVDSLKEKCKGHFTLECDHVYFGVFDEVAEIVQQIMYK